MNLPVVLVLDDAQAARERVRNALRSLSLRVQATDSWVDTKTAVFSASPPDLLVLDLQMPTIDGKAVGRAIKRRLNIPIVIFSSEEPAKIAAAVAEVGAEAGVSKSAPDSELIATISRLLTRRAKLAAPAVMPAGGLLP